jgi:hypothetical protein
VTSSKPSVRDAVGEALAGLLGSTADLLLQFPAMKLIGGAVNGVASVRDAITLKRIELFLQELPAQSMQDRAEFRETMLREDKRTQFGQTVLFLASSADDFEKPKLCGRMVAASINGFIELDTAYRICRMINRAHSEDLKLLVAFKDGLQPKRELEAEALFVAGFLSPAGIDGGGVDEDDGGTLYAINRYGKLLANYALPD